MSALTDDVASYSTKNGDHGVDQMICRWLMICSILLDQKVDFCIDWWHGSILVDWKMCVRYMYIHGITARWYVLFNQNLPCDAILSVKLFSFDWHDLLGVSINMRATLPNLTPLNLFFSSIFYNSLSILYLISILIKFSFYP